GRELLNLASPWLGCNIILFCKLLRIAHSHLKEVYIFYFPIFFLSENFRIFSLYSIIIYISTCMLIVRIHFEKKTNTQSEKGFNRQVVEDAWHDIIRSVFLPSVSLLDTNPGVVNDFWQLLNYYPYEIRYGLYGE